MDLQGEDEGGPGMEAGRTTALETNMAPGHTTLLILLRVSSPADGRVGMVVGWRLGVGGVAGQSLSTWMVL